MIYFYKKTLFFLSCSIILPFLHASESSRVFSKLELLPTELIHMILGYLPEKSLGYLSQANKQFHNITMGFALRELIKNLHLKRKYLGEGFGKQKASIEKFLKKHYSLTMSLAEKNKYTYISLPEALYIFNHAYRMALTIKGSNYPDYFLDGLDFIEKTPEYQDMNGDDAEDPLDEDDTEDTLEEVIKINFLYKNNPNRPSYLKGLRAIPPLKKNIKNEIRKRLWPLIAEDLDLTKKDALYYFEQYWKNELEISFQPDIIDALETEFYIKLLPTSLMKLKPKYLDIDPTNLITFPENPNRQEILFISEKIDTECYEAF